MAVYTLQRSGRKPIPDAIKKLEAGGGKYHNNRPIKDDEHPTPPDLEKLPKPPKGLLTGLALKEYKRVGKILMKMRILTEADHATMEIYASAYANWVEYTIKMQKSPIVPCEKGRYCVSPYEKLVTSEHAKLIHAAAELGLTASSRARIVIDPRKKKGKGEELLS